MSDQHRTFETGATRNLDETKPDYEGFLSPLVLLRFGEYMNANRIMPDGTTRDSDNWQKGIPIDSYMKSAFRHFFDVWLHHRGHGNEATEPLEVALCGLLFNVQGYLHEHMNYEAGFRKAIADREAEGFSVHAVGDNPSDADDAPI